MKIITEEQVEAIGISPRQCVEWVEESFKSKPQADMPAKISVHPFSDSFYTAMPCYHPDVGRVGVKVISRVPGTKPAIKSKMMLFDAYTGDLLALIDTNWITAMRTGATAALAAKTLANNFANSSFALIGLGVIGEATLKCLLSLCGDNPNIWLMRYKNQAEEMSSKFPSIAFRLTSDKRVLVENTNVLFSCVTVMHDQFLPASAYPPGYLCVPVHVRGFQDCDITFDRVIGDDTEHLRNWTNFARFSNFTELSDVLLGVKVGRESPAERILSYNYGLGLHDLWFASRIYDMLQ